VITWLENALRIILRHQGKKNGWSVVIIVSKMGGWSVDDVICARRPTRKTRNGKEQDIMQPTACCLIIITTTPVIYPLEASCSYELTNYLIVEEGTDAFKRCC